MFFKRYWRLLTIKKNDNFYYQRLNKFKNFSKKTESNVKKTNSINVPTQTKKNKEKIEGRNKSNNNLNKKDKIFINDTNNNKMQKIISKDNSNNNINKTSNKKIFI